MVKINLGSGPSGVKGWINYDWGLLPFLGKYKLLSVFVKLKILPKSYDLKWPKIELVDLNKKWPCEDSSVDYIFISQVLEHFDPEDGDKIIKQIFSKLKNNGRLRLSVPDTKKICINYLSDLNIENINEIVWGFDKNIYHNILGRVKRLFIRGHCWLYDENSLSKLLKKNGFKDIKIFKRGRGSFPDLGKLEIVEHEKTGIYLEARKSVL